MHGRNIEVGLLWAGVPKAIKLLTSVSGILLHCSTMVCDMHYLAKSFFFLDVVSFRLSPLIYSAKATAYVCVSYWFPTFLTMSFDMLCAYSVEVERAEVKAAVCSSESQSASENNNAAMSHSKSEDKSTMMQAAFLMMPLVDTLVSQLVTSLPIWMHE